MALTLWIAVCEQLYFVCRAKLLQRRRHHTTRSQVNLYDGWFNFARRVQLNKCLRVDVRDAQLIYLSVVCIVFQRLPEGLQVIDVRAGGSVCVRRVGGRVAVLRRSGAVAQFAGRQSVRQLIRMVAQNQIVQEIHFQDAQQTVDGQLEPPRAWRRYEYFCADFDIGSLLLGHFADQVVIVARYLR